MTISNRLLCLLAAGCSVLMSQAQDDGQKTLTVTGSVQSDVLIPQEDSKIGTG